MSNKNFTFKMTFPYCLEVVRLLLLYHPKGKTTNPVLTLLWVSLFSCFSSRKLVCSQLELQPDRVPSYTTASLKNACVR